VSPENPSPRTRSWKSRGDEVEAALRDEVASKDGVPFEWPKSNGSCIVTELTGWVVAQTCCISQCAKYRKSGILGYPWEQNPGPIAIKLGVRNYVGDPTSATKYGNDRAAWGVSAHARNIAVCDFFFLSFFVPSTRLQVATVDRFS